MKENIYQALMEVGAQTQDLLSKKQAARELTLPLSRKIIQFSANSIRYSHRGEFKEARRLINEASKMLEEIYRQLDVYKEIFFAGFLQDSQKEYVEAIVFLAFAEGTKFPKPKDLGIDLPPYLNGLGESVGELRRYILDALRRDDLSRCEELLGIMDEIYSLLVTVDYPDALTRGLRRTTDMVRGILERTRGDLTMSFRQRELESKLTALENQTK
jgi:translin